MSRKFDGEAKQGSPLEAATWDVRDKEALVAMKEFRATPDQQALFMAWFLRVTAEGELEFRLDARLSAFASGKRWVAKQFFDICSAVIMEIKK